MRSADRPAALDLAVTAAAPGANRLERRRVSHPWSLGRGYPGPDGLLDVIPQVAGAGLLAGETLTQRLEVGPGAGLRLVSAGAMLVHGGGGQARSHWHWRLHPAARAMQAAEAHVLLPGADLSLTTRIDLAPGALYLGFEGVCLADPAAPARWRLETRICAPDGTPLLIDRQGANADAVARLRRLPRAPAAFGTLLLIAPPEVAATLPAGPLGLDGAYATVAPLRQGIGRIARLACHDGGALRHAGLSLLHRVAAGLDMVATPLS
ncbi:MAG: urease accessory protein UreD [Alkalilacustris sp.]